MDTLSRIVYDARGRIYAKSFDTNREVFITSLLGEDDMEEVTFPSYHRWDYDLGNVEDILIG